MGNFTIELNQERAPLTVTNILAYVDSGHYTNTLIHRVVADFVIQRQRRLQCRLHRQSRAAPE